jgi:hypothetical protein
VAGILQLLPELWSDADGQPLMRIQVRVLMLMLYGLFAAKSTQRP